MDREVQCCLDIFTLIYPFSPLSASLWETVGQGPTVLVVGAGGYCLDIFTLIYPFSPLSASLWETVGWLVVLGLTAL